jgi:hypothetical protein
MDAETQRCFASIQAQLNAIVQLLNAQALLLMAECAEPDELVEFTPSGEPN